MDNTKCIQIMNLTDNDKYTSKTLLKQVSDFIRNELPDISQQRIYMIVIPS